MSKKKHLQDEPKEQTTTKRYLYTGIICGALGFIFYILILAISMYGLITGIVFEIAALGFLRTQQLKNPQKVCKIIQIICYILLGIGVLIFLGGVLYSYLAANP